MDSLTLIGIALLAFALLLYVSQSSGRRESGRDFTDIEITIRYRHVAQPTYRQLIPEAAIRRLIEQGGDRWIG